MGPIYFVHRKYLPVVDELVEYIQENVKGIQHVWLIAHLHSMPYDRDYISGFSDEKIKDPYHQGINRIQTFCKYGSCDFEDW